MSTLQLVPANWISPYADLVARLEPQGLVQYVQEAATMLDYVNDEYSVDGSLISCAIRL